MKTVVKVKANGKESSSWLRQLRKIDGDIVLVTKLARVQSRRDYRVTYPFYCTDEMWQSFLGCMGEVDSIGKAFNEFIGRLQRTQEAADAINAWKQANQA